jgi:hypothetical protein
VPLAVHWVEEREEAPGWVCHVKIMNLRDVLFRWEGQVLEEVEGEEERRYEEDFIGCWRIEGFRCLGSQEGSPQLGHFTLHENP